MYRKKMMCGLIFLSFLAASCQPKGRQHADLSSEVRDQAQKYFQIFADRQDWQALLSFYDEEIIFEDLNQDLVFEGLEAFRGFYNWPDNSFSKLSPDQAHLEIEELIVRDTVAIARGHFNPFLWHGERIEGIEDFTIWLYFNDSLKIVRQLDYIEYPVAFLPEE